MKLYELLAIEKTSQSQLHLLLTETLGKFNKEHFFKGWIKTLRMLSDSPDNDAVEKAGSESREVVTTVYDTLDYLLKYWVKHEDIQFKKNSTNRSASADVVIDNELSLLDIPVDELMGLENRLSKLREVFQNVPTIDATKEWEQSNMGEHIWKSKHPDVTTKTEKVVTPVVLYEATKEHPAQVKEISKDETIGSFTTWHFSGAITSLQKAQLLDRVDCLIEEVKKARMKANDIPVIDRNIGQAIINYLIKPLK